MGSCCRVQGTGTGLEIKEVCPSLDLGTQNCKKLGKSFQPYVPPSKNDENDYYLPLF